MVAFQATSQLLPGSVVPANSGGRMSEEEGVGAEQFVQFLDAYDIRREMSMAEESGGFDPDEVRYLRAQLLQERKQGTRASRETNLHVPRHVADEYDLCRERSMVEEGAPFYTDDISDDVSLVMELRRELALYEMQRSAQVRDSKLTA